MQADALERRIVVLTVILVCVAVCAAILNSSVMLSPSLADEPRATKPPSLPPLVIDRSTPLLLDARKPAVERAFLRINNACFVCHDNYKDESLVVVHAKEDVGCVDCHGKSLEHQNDEDNITPPEIMYPLAKVDGLCRECHDSHDVSAKRVLKRWRERCPERADFDEIACTDCHGYHRLEKRIVRWDKVTGDVILQAPEENSQP